MTLKIVNSHGRAIEHKVQMTSGEPITLKNHIKLAIISITPPPIPILSEKFIGKKRIILADEIDPKLYCETRAVAEKLKECKLKTDTCQSSITDPTINYICPSGDLENLFANTNKVLPIKSGEFWLNNDANKLYATLPHAALQLQISLEHYHLTANFDATSCEIIPIQLIGCYSCLNGAK